jgi:hypothetical protein
MESRSPGEPPWSMDASRLVARLREIVVPNLLARGLDAVTIAFVVAFHRVLSAKTLHAPPGFDERYFLWEGFSVTRGMVPYRDFQEFKPPMIMFVNALGLKLFGLHAMGYRRLFALFSLGAFLAVTIALLSRRTSRLLVGALVALMISHFFFSGFHDSSIDNSESVGLFFFMIGTSILLIKTRWLRTQQVLGAAILALAPMSKEPMAFVTLAAWLCILCLHHFESGRANAAPRFAFFTILGVAGSVGIWFVYMLATHSLGWYVVQLKLSIAYTKNYAYQLGWFPRDPAEGIFAESWRRLRENYVNYARMGPFVPLFVASISLWGRRFVVGCLALAAIIGGLYGVTIGHGFLPHYFVMAMTGTFFAATVGAIALDGYARSSPKGLRWWVGISWVAGVLLALWPQFSEEREKQKSYVSSELPVSPAELAFVRDHSTRDDRIWTLADPLLYVCSDRLNALREGTAVDEILDYYPGDTDEQRLAGHREELIRNPPKLIIVGDDPQSASREQRITRVLVNPFLHDFGYRKVSDRFYVRP